MPQWQGACPLPGLVWWPSVTCPAGAIGVSSVARLTSVTWSTVNPNGTSSWSSTTWSWWNSTFAGTRSALRTPERSRLCPVGATAMSSPSGVSLTVSRSRVPK